MKKYFYSFALVLIFGIAAAERAEAQSLTAAVRKAIDSNPELQAFVFNRQAIDQELESAKGLGLPSVDTRLGVGHRATDQSLPARGSGNGEGYRSRNRLEAGVSVTQRLFDGFERDNQVARQINRVESARNRVLDTANSVALQTVQAYLEVLRSQRVLAVATVNVQAHETILNKVRDRASSGRSMQSEVNQAMARLQAAKASQAEAQGRTRDARSLYVAVVGAEPGKLSATPTIARRLPSSVDAAVAAAKQSSPAIFARMYDYHAAQSAIGVARAEFYPKVNAEAGVDHVYDTDRSTGRRTDAYAMVVLKQNLYRGGIDTARVREARSRADEAAALEGQTTRSVERDVRISWSAIQTARARSDAISRQLDQNRTVIASYYEQFELGQRTLLDILDIQNEIFVNASVLETERFIAEFNSYRVIAAMGKLIQALGLQNPEAGVRNPSQRVHVIPKGAL